MNCPVCKVKIEFKAPDLEEVYYDCSHCSSSLLFKKGKCEVLSEGIVQGSASKEFDSNEKDIGEQELVPGLNSDKSAQNEVSIEGEIKKEKDLETSQEEHQSPSFQETKEESKTTPEAEPGSSISEGKSVEEEFVPEEATQVPEISEEELSDPISKTEGENLEESEPLVESAKAQDSETSAGDEDLIFEEEPKAPFSEVQEKNLNPEDSPQKEKDFSDVVEFGNTQDESQKGPLLYDLKLREINSQSLKDLICSTLEDEFLNISFSEEDMKEGQIDILKISPVQAYVIVTALMGLPLQISWSQHHIAED